MHSRPRTRRRDIKFQYKGKENCQKEIHNNSDKTYGILFVKKVCQALIGSWVRLSNGKKAKIIYIDQSRTSALPIVETEDGNFWDIATKQGVDITCLLTYDELLKH